eukprot:7137639-Ditylum_brightwellii.AAC.1
MSHTHKPLKNIFRSNLLIYKDYLGHYRQQMSMLSTGSENLMMAMSQLQWMALWLTGRGPCDRALTPMTSYRLDLAGILAVLYLLCALTEHSSTSITTKQELFCDNAAAVVCANNPIIPGIKLYIATDYDLCKEIETTKEFGIELKKLGQSTPR